MNAQGDTLTNSQPNVVFILTDDQGYGELACHGNPVIHTPALDRLHAESTRLTNFHVAPSCAPTRAQLMSGMHEFRVGVTHTIWGRERLDLNAVTLAEILSEAGYATGIFGKWHLGDQHEYRPDQRGFDECLVHAAGWLGQVRFGDHPDNRENPYWDPTLYQSAGTYVKTKGYCTDIFFSAALDWIKKRRERPFFAYIPTNCPHVPLLVPERYSDGYSDSELVEGGDKYYGMITNIDDNVALLCDRLDEWGLADNTLVVFMTDNGHAINGPGQAGHAEDGFLEPGGLYNAGMRGGKAQPWEGGTRVPCFFRWPGTLERGRDLKGLAGGIDFLPTLADLCGATVPDGIDGRSLVPLIEGGDNQWPERRLVAHVGRWPMGLADEYRYRQFAVRSQEYRFVNDTELHDMVQDPGEKQNVIGRHPDLVAEMRSFYDQWWDETRPLMSNE